ncbi:hypothetical protein DFJ74DRAFT_674455 [Hyaloraphidium curvatum]|nr:hypothetical protein DFJ74DRAFT_674455 [Hyaloraphidium curvatum]
MKFLEAMKRFASSSDDKPKFVDERMEQQRKRLRIARRNANRVAVDMSRSRAEIMQREKELMVQVRKAVERGDTATAKILAAQVVHFRSLAAENLIASTKIVGRAVVSESRSRLTADSLQAMRGIVWAEKGGQKAIAAMELSKLAEEADTVDDLSNETFDEIYSDDASEDEVEEGSPASLKVLEVLREAAQALHPASPTQRRGTAQIETVTVVLKVWRPTAELGSPGISPFVVGEDAEAAEAQLLAAAFPRVPKSEPTLESATLTVQSDVNVAELTRMICADPVTCKRLGLKQKGKDGGDREVRKFRLGRIASTGGFAALEEDMSLQPGAEKDTIWVMYA